MTDTHTSLQPFASTYDGEACRPGVAHQYLNHACLLTHYDATDPYYAQEMTVTIGRNRESKKWVAKTMPIATFVELLSTHREDPKKDGLAFVLAEIVGHQRRKQAVKTCYGVGLDIDVGVSGAVIDAALKEMGCLAIRYTTHSHNKTTTFLNKDRVMKWAAKNGQEELDEYGIKRFLGEEEDWLPELIETVTYLGDDHLPEGLMIQLEHDPMPKHRVVVPLATPYEVAKIANTHEEGMRKWNEIPKALARALGDLPLDKAALDPSRLFYFPRHAPGRTFETTIFGGPLLDWSTLDLDGSPKDAFEAALEAEINGYNRSGGGSRSTTKEGRDLGRWSIKCAHGFQIVDVIRDFDPDRIRTNGAHKIDIECPFDDHHSNPGAPEDKGCFAVNAGDGPSGIFTIKCQHHSCQERTNLDFLGKMLKDGWFEDDVLESDMYNAVVGETVTPAQALLTTAFPPPPGGHGDYSYQTFDGRAWLYSLPKPGPKGTAIRLHTPCCIESGISFPDRNHQRGLRVKILDEGGETHLLDVSAGMAVRSYGTELKVALREKGVLMTEEGEKHLVKLFKQMQPADPIVVYNRPGWHGSAFITPWGKAVGSNRVMELSAENRPVGIDIVGTLSEWKEATVAVFRSGVLHFQIGVLSGLVSPILDLCGYSSVLIGYSGSTSKGKSTAQKLQAACWGDPAPKKGLFGNFNGTAAASEALLARASGAGYAFDEAHTIDGGELQKLVFKASGDGGADRLKRTAELREARSWTLLVTLSSEISLYQKIKGAGATMTTGLGARALDLNVEDAPSLDQPTMKAIEAAFANHGHAGPEFVRGLISLGYANDPDRLRLEVDNKTSALAGHNAEPPAIRAARIAALIWQAGVIAQSAGLVPEDFEMESMAHRLWARVMEAETAPGSAETMAIQTLFENLIKGRGVGVVEFDNPGYRDPVAWRRNSFKTHGNVYIVPVTGLSALAGGSISHTVIASALAKRGHGIPNPRTDKKSYIWDTIPGLGRVRSVVIRAEAVDSEESP